MHISRSIILPCWCYTFHFIEIVHTFHIHDDATTSVFIPNIIISSYATFPHFPFADYTVTSRVQGHSSEYAWKRLELIEFNLELFLLTASHQLSFLILRLLRHSIIIHNNQQAELNVCYRVHNSHTKSKLFFPLRQNHLKLYRSRLVLVVVLLPNYHVTINLCTLPFCMHDREGEKCVFFMFLPQLP